VFAAGPLVGWGGVGGAAFGTSLATCTSDSSKMTSNPSEEQLELVAGRIVEIAQAICPFVALEAETYFDEAGFDDDMCKELFKRVVIYIENPEGVEPSLEDHPSARRLARYLLENVDYDVLEAPLSSKLLAEMEEPKKAGGGGALLFGLPRPVVLGGLIVLLLALCALAYFAIQGGASSPSPALEGAGGKHSTHGHGGKGFGGKRNGSRFLVQS